MTIYYMNIEINYGGHSNPQTHLYGMVLVSHRTEFNLGCFKQSEHAVIPC